MMLMQRCGASPSEDSSDDDFFSHRSVTQPLSSVGSDFDLSISDRLKAVERRLLCIEERLREHVHVHEFETTTMTAPEGVQVTCKKKGSRTLMFQEDTGNLSYFSPSDYSRSHTLRRHSSLDMAYRSSVFAPFGINPRGPIEEDESYDLENDYVLPSDMWGATIFMFIYDFHSLLHGHIEHSFRKVIRLRAAVVFFLSIINVIMQFTAVYMFRLYVVRLEVSKVQESYATFHRDAFFPNGSLDEDIWQQWWSLPPLDNPFVDLCQSAFAFPGFTAVIMFLWSVRMLGEVREIISLQWQMLRFVWAHGPRGAPLNHGSVETNHVFRFEDNKSIVIERVTIELNIVIFLFVMLPRFIIAICVFVSGLTWLASAHSIEELILNALALEFIVSIDELIFAQILPRTYAELVQNTKFEMQQVLPENLRQILQRRWQLIFGYTVMLMAFVWVYFNFMQEVLPGFNHDIQSSCHGMVDVGLAPRCPLCVGPLSQPSCALFHMGLPEVEDRKCEFPFGLNDTLNNNSQDSLFMTRGVRNGKRGRSHSHAHKR